MRRRLTLGAAALAIAVTLGGCMHDSSTIALVDLDAVARQLGRSETMNNDLKTFNESLTKDLQTRAAELKVQIDSSMQALAANPTPEARQQHQQLLLQSNRTLEESKREATRKANEKRKELIVAFRREARPAVEKIAREKGLKVVFTTADNVVWAEKTLDITSDVLAAMGGPKTN